MFDGTSALSQGSLFDVDEPLALRRLDVGMSRTPLAHGAWVDHRPGWLGGAQELFEALARDVPWEAERRQMYERMVDVPRLLKFYTAWADLPHPLLAEARESLSDHYEDELGERFATTGLCFYRDERDSVAWHGDRIGRSRDTDTMIAILSVGDARTLQLRPRGGGESIGFSLGHGDLVVMGGSCQRTWEHCIAKETVRRGPRISIQYRVRGVR